MPALPYAIGAYRRDNAGLPEMRVVNQYIEAAPAAGGAPVLLARPGQVLLRDEGATGQRGLFQAANVLGGALVSVSDQVRVNGLAVGAASGFDRARFAPGLSEVLICMGGGLYRTDGAGLAPVAFPDDAPVADIGYLRGRFVGVERASGRLFWSDLLDGTTWDALSFATAEKQADNLVACLAVGDFLWLFGETTTEVWAPTLDADLPFAPIDGRVYTHGCASRDTVVQIDNTAFWVSEEGIALRGGEVPLRISNSGIEERIAATPAGDLSAWAFNWRGHLFYALATAQGTFCFDVSTGEWSEWKSYGRTNWRAGVGVQVGSQVYAGDTESGRIWRLSDDAATDEGVEIERIFTALAPFPNGTMRCDNLGLSVAVGRAPLGGAPQIEMRFSRDGGFTWSVWSAVSLGGQGEYRTRVNWNRLGLIDAPGRVFEFRLTDEAPWRVSGVRINERLGGLGR